MRVSDGGVFRNPLEIREVSYDKWARLARSSGDPTDLFIAAVREVFQRFDSAAGGGGSVSHEVFNNIERHAGRPGLDDTAFMAVCQQYGSSSVHLEEEEYVVSFLSLFALN